MVILEYTKEDKNLAKRLATQLESSGVSCWYYSRDAKAGDKDKLFEDALNKASAIIFIYSFKKDKDSYLIKKYQSVFETDKPVIFYITDKPGNSLSAWHFLNTVDWVNAYDVSFDTSAKALVTLLHDMEGREGSSLVKTHSEAGTSKKRKDFVSVAVAFIIVALALYFMFFKEKDTGTEVNTTGHETVLQNIAPGDSAQSAVNFGVTRNISEDDLIGSWSLEDYTDDIPRSPQEQAEFEKTIEQLKKTFKFIFYKDHKFLRYGFNPNGDRGTWTLDAQNRILYISDMQGTGKDPLKIKVLNDSVFIFEVSSYLDNQNIAIVRFHLRKEL